MDNSIIKGIINEITNSGPEKLRIMEVCGTHTQAVSQSGIISMLPPNITLLSGPGCPVCVTDEGHIDAAIQMLNNHDVLMVTFGDMMRVRGTFESLSDQLNKRKSIAVVYSPLDCLELAQKNPDRQVVFFAVGFETTAPGIALAVKLACENKLQNLTFLTSLKLMPPVLHSILREKQKGIHGIICPGHVAAVKGAGYFRFIPQQYDVSAAICGFLPLDIAAGLHFLSKQYAAGTGAKFENLYESCVNEEGNRTANRIMQEIFDIDDAYWRGIGEIKESSLVLCERYSGLDALRRFDMEPAAPSDKYQCNCRDVLLGNILPEACGMFGKLCTPQSPVGPCMVSREGSCSTYYRYRERV